MFMENWSFNWLFVWTLFHVQGECVLYIAMENAICRNHYFFLIVPSLSIYIFGKTLTFNRVNVNPLHFLPCLFKLSWWFVWSGESRNVKWKIEPSQQMFKNCSGQLHTSQHRFINKYIYSSQCNFSCFFKNSMEQICNTLCILFSKNVQ